MCQRPGSSVIYMIPHMCLPGTCCMLCQHCTRLKLGLLLLLMTGKAHSLKPVPAGLTELGTFEGQDMLRNSTPPDRFWQLAQEFVTQDSQDWCGLASASMVLNALPIPKPALRAFQGWVPLLLSGQHFKDVCASSNDS